MAQSSISQASGHGYTTTATALKYRTKNSGNPLQHTDVDANFDILRKAINGIVTDISGVAGNTVNTNVPVNAVFTDTQLTTAEVRAKFSAGTNVTISNGVISSSFTNTTYSVGDGGLTEKNFTSALLTKLNAISSSANNYSLPVAATAIGGVKAGGDIDISAAGVMTIKAGSITTTEIASTVNLGGVANLGIFTEVLRFKTGYVGNKYATSGYTIAATRAQIIAGGATTINVGIGGAFSPLDGKLTSGRYMLVCHYPGNGVAWYTNSLPNQWKNQHMLSGFIAGSQVGHIEPDIYYTEGQGQSIPFTIGAGSHVHMRGDGVIDIHLASGNTASWSYAVISFLKYT